ncbi:hypothetical protein KEJ15_02260 [Candidatus Bathyarchaeota archaeon]|nr:hypothetical protein [Candidatus Bathyarchaeota archaeon]
MKRNRRDNFQIVSDILSCAAKGVSKAVLMYKAGLSSTQMDRYVEALLRSELLEVLQAEEKYVYKTTTKGKIFLETFGELARIID